ncbi:hypothetical protein [Vibrio coralliilyticus]|uniref:hypothetical protein n=1 Tax=Vibrio coralliilyticus TaxID=190893 RepID=UPI002FD2351D
MREVFSKLLVPILTGIMGLSGVLIGAYVSADKAEELWLQQQREAKLNLILLKRVELIERVSKIANYAPKYRNYQGFIELHVGLNRDAMLKYEKCKEEKKGDCVEPEINVAIAKDVTEMSLKRADLNAEFAPTIQLVALYFKCDAKTLAHEFQDMTEWWSPSNESKFKGLIAAMLKEVTPESFTSCSNESS